MSDWWVIREAQIRHRELEREAAMMRLARLATEARPSRPSLPRRALYALGEVFVRSGQYLQRCGQGKLMEPKPCC